MTWPAPTTPRVPVVVVHSALMVGDVFDDLDWEGFDVYAAIDYDVGGLIDDVRNEDLIRIGTDIAEVYQWCRDAGYLTLSDHQHFKRKDGRWVKTTNPKAKAS